MNFYLTKKIIKSKESFSITNQDLILNLNKTLLIRVLNKVSSYYQKSFILFLPILFVRDHESNVFFICISKRNTEKI